MMKVVPYNSTLKRVWDDFVEQSKNATFLLKRDYMDYHSSRFCDCSVIVYDNDKVVALIPANWDEQSRTVWSHQGLTYGGLLLTEHNTVGQTLQIIQSILKFWQQTLAAHTLIYKAIPYIYNVYPGDEDMYALSRVGAKLKWRMVSTVVDTAHPIKMRTLRLRGIKKALSANCHIERVGEEDSISLRQFWTLLEHVLQRYHNATPVHSYTEILELIRKFPKEIRLYVVKQQDSVVAGTVIFETRRVAHVQYIASGEYGRKIGALDLLFKHLITEQYVGLPYFDLGTSVLENGRVLNEGLVFQKEGFGGRAVCYDVYEVPIRERVSPSCISYLNLGRLNSRFQPELENVVCEVTHSGRYLFGEWNERFNKAWATYCGRKHCVNVGNGLDALTLTLMAYRKLYDWKDCNEVIVPANTYIATILSVVRAGLCPVLCEPDLSTALMSPNSAMTLVTEKTVALLPVHLYGNYCDMTALRALADEKHLILIDDCAQGHGLISEDNKSKADVNCWSFYPGKNLGALGDAGAVTTDDADVARIISEMSNYGQSEKYVNAHVGCNSRMDEVQAAALCVKLPYLREDNERRRAIAAMYREGISNPLIKVLDVQPPHSVYHIFPVMCSERDKLKQWLSLNDVETLIHYPIPPHHQEAMRGVLPQKSYPITERIAREELSLPIAPYLTDDDVARVISAVNAFHS